MHIQDSTYEIMWLALWQISHDKFCLQAKVRDLIIPGECNSMYSISILELWCA